MTDGGYTAAKRGLDSICTSDTDHLSRVLRPERHPAQKVALGMALRGRQVSRTLFVDSDQPYCDEPVKVVVAMRGSVSAQGVETIQFRPCRKCAKCLRFRQLRWRQRALHEVARSKRTWFVTLTFSPAHLAGILIEAKSGELARVERAAYRHVQRYLKRLRKAVPRCKVRYLAVYERGETTGRSHYHLLIHETGERPVHKAQLEGLWASFVHARLVSASRDGAASYVTKYLTKSIGIRPRASNDYGRLL